MRSLTIDGRLVSDTTAAYVIAEIGHNHQGDLEKAKEMFKAAKECGADAVKLQKRNNRELFTKAMYDKPYDNENSFGATYGEHREALEFGREEYVELQKYAREIGVTFFATAFDHDSADFLASLDMPAYKLASGDLRNIPLLRHVAKIGKPMIISTGGAEMADVERAVAAIMEHNKQLCVLQCTATYPSQAEEMNLSVIASYRAAFPDLVIGLSDHYNGIAVTVAAYMLGARVIEKHFTLNHAAKGTDHAMSLEPIGMRKLVRDLERVSVALGDGRKRQLPQEASALQKMGKSLVARTALPAGHQLRVEDIALRSPGGGLPPYMLDEVVGRKLQAALAPDDAITLEQLSPANGTGPAKHVASASRS
jgi:sialic acid synthase